MNAQAIIKIVTWFVVFFLLQIFVFRGFILFNFAFGFIYLAALLRVKRDFDRTLFIFIAFVFGLLVDIFYNTGAIHAAACVFMAWCRGFVLDRIIPARGLESDNDLTIKALTLPRYVTYTTFMLLVHHSALFLIEAGSSGSFLFSMGKILASVLFNLLVILIFNRIVKY